MWNNIEGSELNQSDQGLCCFWKGTKTHLEGPVQCISNAIFILLLWVLLSLCLCTGELANASLTMIASPIKPICLYVYTNHIMDNKQNKKKNHQPRVYIGYKQLHHTIGKVHWDKHRKERSEKSVAAYFKRGSM